VKRIFIFRSLPMKAAHLACRKSSSKAGGHSDAPKIAVDDKGTVHLVYAENSTGPFRRYYIRYTRSIEGKDTFEIPREISGLLADQVSSVNFPALSLDGADNLYVIWELFPHEEGYRSQGLGFTYSNDGGHTFVSPSVVPGSKDPTLGFNGSRQGLLMRKLAVNNEGAVAVVNSTFKKNEMSHVWLFRGQVSD